MPDYESPQEIEANMDLDTMKKILTDAEVKFHPAEKEKKLSQKVFKVYGGSKSTPDDDTIDAEKLNKIAASIRKEAEGVKKSQPNKTKCYIANAHNYNLPRKGVNKATHKIMRYVDNYDSLDIEAQNRTGEVFKLPPILFRGINSEHKLHMGNFVGRSVLNTDNPLLQEFIETHRRFGSDFIVYDKEEITRGEMVKDRKVTKIKNWVYEHATHDDLVSILSYINMKAGSSNYEVLMGTTDLNALRFKANQAAVASADDFLAVMESKEAKFIHLVHKASDRGLIKISRDGRDVILAENNKVVCQSSVSSDWENDLVQHLLTPEGFPLLRRMEKDTGYTVI